MGEVRAVTCAVRVRRAGCPCAALFCADDVVDDIVCDTELPNLLLHGVFKHVFLVGDQGALFFIVCDTCSVFAPVAAPPVAPCVTAGSL
jgi:hypothetical protein